MLARDGEDPGETKQIEGLQEEIKNLQATLGRSRDKLLKLRKKSQEQDARLQNCTEDIESLEKERERAGRTKESTTHKGEAQMDQEVSRTVKELLQKRVPALGADKTVGSADSDDEIGGDEQVDLATCGDSTKEHDTVVVTYRMQTGLHDEGDDRDAYKATFRIDSETTVLGLHKDVCKYWGCSHAEHALVKYQRDKDKGLEVKIIWASDLYKWNIWKHTENDIWSAPDSDKSDKPKCSITEDTKLVGFGSNSILPKGEKAQLSLIQRKAFDITKSMLSGQDLSDDDDLQDNTTLFTASKKHGVKSEQMEEPHVALLEPWPGLYHLLKERDESYEYRQPWRRSRLMDFVCYGLLLILSVSCLTFRNARDAWELRRGVSETLVYGIAGETSNATTGPFTSIGAHDEIWSWLSGTFHYQLFNENSTLRQHYVPVGYLRLRQHRVKPRDCGHDEVLMSLKPTTCYHVLVDSQSEETSDLVINSSWLSAPREPNPLKFGSAPVSAQPTYGRLQSAYYGSGYMIDYDLARVVSGALDTQVLLNTGEMFLNDLDHIRDEWISKATRALEVEATLANYDLGGYVGVHFVIEYSAGGAVTTTNWIKPFFLHTNWTDQTAHVLDWIRCIIGAAYISLVALYYHLHDKVKCDQAAIGASGYDKKRKPQSGFRYVLSFYGILDACIVGTVVATVYMRGKPAPDEPSELTTYYSYTFEADKQEHLAVAESAILALVTCRLVSFMQMDASIYRFYKVVRRCINLFPHFLGAFLPVYFATVFIGNAIWSSQIWGFSTWSGSFLMTFMTYQQAVDVFELNDASHNETIPFVLLCFMTMQVLLVSLFLAITVYAYFEVEILDGANPIVESWDREKWLDWALWPGLFQKFCPGGRVGASWREGPVEDEEDDREGDDAEDEDPGDARQDR
ncbi:unnamed protein product [Prorocentrum cordatum]|uniref:Polycystin domain-containing protein n=1 Tax=Prorocentrum cordatum TaxID=2364126 RepID=A0ABN9QQR0_9DINO|nr:unnamed protein product [Polarella glacialis]